MTDARLPAMWVSQMRFSELDDVTWRIFTGALMWCNEQGTDGRIPRRYLPTLPPFGEQPNAYAALVKAGIWERSGDFYQFTDWSKKASEGGLGQSTAEAVERNRESARQRQRRHRATLPTSQTITGADRAGLDLTSDPATGDVTVTVTRDVGQGQQGSVEPTIYGTRAEPQRGSRDRVMESTVSNRDAWFPAEEEMPF